MGSEWKQYITVIRLLGVLEMEFICPAWHHSIEDLFEAIPDLAARNLRAIEALIGSSFLETANPQEVERLLLNLRLSNLRVNSVHAPFGEEIDFSSFDDNTHERGVASVIEALELAQLLNAKYLIIHPGHEAVFSERKKRLDRSVGVIRELAVIAEESGVMLAVENMPPDYLCDNTDEMLRVIEEASSRAVGICFDTGHANMTRSFERLARHLLPYTVTMHIHDNDGTTDQHLFPGNGTIDWKMFSHLCRQHCPNAPMLIECEPPAEWDWLRACAEVARLMGK